MQIQGGYLTWHEWRYYTGRYQMIKVVGLSVTRLIERRRNEYRGQLFHCVRILNLFAIWCLMPGPPSQSPCGAKSIFSLFSEIYNLQMAVNTPSKHRDTNIQQTLNWVQDALVWSHDHSQWCLLSRDLSLEDHLSCLWQFWLTFVINQIN